MGVGVGVAFGKASTNDFSAAAATICFSSICTGEAAGAGTGGAGETEAGVVASNFASEWERCHASTPDSAIATTPRSVMATKKVRPEDSLGMGKISGIGEREQNVGRHFFPVNEAASLIIGPVCLTGLEECFSPALFLVYS